MSANNPAERESRVRASETSGTTESPQPTPQSGQTPPLSAASHPSRAKAKATVAARRAATGYRIGDRVRTDTPRSPRFHDRIGAVAGINLGEVGVIFTPGSDRVDAWFLPSELTKIRPATGGTQ